MAKKKKTVEFVLTEPPEDLGNRIYAFGEATRKGKIKSKAKIGERKKVWRSPASIYMFLLGAFLTFWFLYSFIAALVNGGGIGVLLDFGTSFFALVVCLVIIICSVFGLWSKFARFALNHGMVHRREVANVEAVAEMTDEAYEKAQAPKPFLEVYDDYIRATDNGAIKIINRAGVAKIKAFELRGGYWLAIISDGDICNYELVCLHGLKMPMREVKKLQAIFGDKLIIEPLVDKNVAKSERRERRVFSGFNVAPLAVGGICAAVGGGVIALHFCLAESISIALGAFFIAGGVLFMFAAFENVPIIKVFFIPLIFGGIFSSIPALFVKTIADANGISVLFASVHQFLCSFNGLFCAVAFLEAMGIFMLVYAFYSLYKYIRYGEQ